MKNPESLCQSTPSDVGIFLGKLQSSIDLFIRKGERHQLRLVSPTDTPNATVRKCSEALRSCHIYPGQTPRFVSEFRPGLIAWLKNEVPDEKDPEIVLEQNCSHEEIFRAADLLTDLAGEHPASESYLLDKLTTPILDWNFTRQSSKAQTQEPGTPEIPPAPSDESTVIGPFTPERPLTQLPPLLIPLLEEVASQRESSSPENSPPRDPNPNYNLDAPDDPEAILREERQLRREREQREFLGYR